MEILNRENAAVGVKINFRGRQYTITEVYPVGVHFRTSSRGKLNFLYFWEASKFQVTLAQ